MKDGPIGSMTVVVSTCHAQCCGTLRICISGNLSLEMSALGAVCVSDLLLYAVPKLS
jgi:hypothetical protein